MRPSNLQIAWSHALPHIVLGAAIFVVCLGFAMIAARLGRATWLDAYLTSVLYAKTNTALLFIACGLGLAAALTISRRFALLAGGLVAAVGAAMIVEHLTGVSLGVDELLVRDLRSPHNPYPGRMSPNTTLAFLCAGLCIAGIKQSWRKSWQIGALELLAFLVVALGIEGMLAHVDGIERAYRWSDYARMALPTSVGFLVLGTGLMALGLQTFPCTARIPLWAPALLCFTVLMGDIATPRGVAAGIAYIPLIFCSLWFTRPSTAFIFAGIATGLTILAFFAKVPTAIAAEIFIANRVITMGALWFTAVLVYLRRKTEIALTEALDQRASAQKDLAKREEVFRVTFDAATVGKVQSDPETGRIIRANRAFADMLGYEPDELVGRTGWELTWPDDVDIEKSDYKRVLGGEIHAYVREKRYIRKDGTPIWGRVSATIARLPENGQPNIAVAVVEDIDERYKFEVALQAAKHDLEGVVVERTTALEQRDLLLREVYHRVKNNLQIIDSLVLMQIRQLADEDAKYALQSLRSRVYALGLVHQQLMGSDDLQTFNIAPFLEQLSNNLMRASAGRNISLSVQAIPLNVGLDFAIPLGLLVTELITNSLKHAFPNGTGAIEVTLAQSGAGNIDLVVADNGKGYPGAVIGSCQRKGLGSSIIDGLVAQLEGTLLVESAHGTRTEICLAAPLRA